MKFTKLKAAGIAAGVAVFALMSSSAEGFATQTRADGPGTDYDPGCILATTLVNGANSRGACPGLSLYDGSRGAEDLAGVTLASGSGQVTATYTLNTAAIPAAGSISVPDGTTNSLDTTNAVFQGVTMTAMYQNIDKEHNGDNVGSGCARVGVGRVRDQHGHWRDGYHYFLAISVQWDGSKWFYSAQVGEFDPSPDGAFFFQELGTNDGVDDDFDGSPWDATDPVNRPRGAGAAGTWDVTGPTTSGGQTTWGLEVDGRLSSSDPTCATGVYVQDFGSNTPGPYSASTTGSRAAFGCPAYTSDCIANIKGLSFGNEVLTLPITVPLSLLTCNLPVIGNDLCTPDLKSLAGFIVPSDTTAGNSTAGLLNNNIPGIAYTASLFNDEILGGQLFLPDTLGDGPTCPTPTVGGTLPDNPVWAANQDQSCQFDDDGTLLGRGTLLPEFWDNGGPLSF